MRDKTPIKRPKDDRGFDRNNELDRKIVFSIIVLVCIAVVVLIGLIILINVI